MAATSSVVMQALVAIIVLVSPAAGQISSGYATYSNPGGGVCSGGGSLPGVSMNAAQFANGAACGQCIQISGTGNGAGADPVSTAPYVAQISNVCPQCAYGDIDLQESGDGKFGITWSFVGCPGGGRKLMESSFQADKTVYTGFAHKGLTPVFKKDDVPVAAPVEAPEQIQQQTVTEQTVTETEIANDVPSQEALSTETTEEIVQTATIELVEHAQASQGHLEPEQTSEEVVVKISRRLLMAN